jgi:hypothetical protein
VRVTIRMDRRPGVPGPRRPRPPGRAIRCPYWPDTSDRVRCDALGPGPHRLADILDIAMTRIEVRRAAT